MDVDRGRGERVRPDGEVVVVFRPVGEVSPWVGDREVDEGESRECSREGT